MQGDWLDKYTQATVHILEDSSYPDRLAEVKEWLEPVLGQVVEGAYRSGVVRITHTIPNWSYRVFSALPIQRWIKEPKAVGLWGEFLLGTQLGLLLGR